MAVVKILDNPTPDTSTGWLASGIFTVGNAISLIPNSAISSIGCLCSCDLESILMGLGNPNDFSNEIENDDPSLVQIRNSSADSIKFFIEKDGVEIEEMTNDAWGTLRDYGTFNNPNARGYILNFGKVIANISGGEGIYRFRTEVTAVGQVFNIYTIKYEIHIYQDYLANGTTLFRWTQNGEIENGLDLRGENWGNSIRLPGKFGYNSPETIIDEYPLSDRRFDDITKQEVNIYKFECDPVFGDVYSGLVKDLKLANNINVTDFNIYNAGTYTDLPIRYFEPDGDPNYIEQTKLVSFNLKFKDRIENTIKRNHF
jgi:hypothetical protein